MCIRDRCDPRDERDGGDNDEHHAEVRDLPQLLDARMRLAEHDDHRNRTGTGEERRRDGHDGHRMFVMRLGLFFWRLSLTSGRGVETVHRREQQ